MHKYTSICIYRCAPALWIHKWVMHSKEGERTCKLLSVIYKFLFLTLLFLLVSYHKNRCQVQVSPLHCQEPQTWGQEEDWQHRQKSTRTEVSNEWNLHCAHYQAVWLQELLKISSLLPPLQFISKIPVKSLAAKGHSSSESQPFHLTAYAEISAFQTGPEQVLQLAPNPGSVQIFLIFIIRMDFYTT